MRAQKKDLSNSGRKPYVTPRLISHGGMQKLTRSTKSGSSLHSVGGGHTIGGGGSSSPVSGTHGWNYYTRG